MSTHKKKEKTKCRALLDYALPFTWKQENNLGIPIFDVQHQGFVAALNSLHFAMANKFGAAMLEPIIHTVNEYARFHFMTEELVFEKCHYPKSKQHIEAHNELKESLLDIGQECMISQDPEPFVKFLEEWLTDHVLDKDQECRDYLLKSNIG